MEEKDRRVEQRVPTRAFLVKVNGDCHYIFGYARDVSRSGMQLRTFSTCLPYPLKVGETVELEFRIPDKELEVRCKAELMWSQRPLGGSLMTMIQGVRFVGMDNTLKGRLSDWVNSLT